MTLAAPAFVPPNSAMASSLRMSDLLPIAAVKHTLQETASASYTASDGADTVAPMDERALTMQGRIFMACENAGFNLLDDSPAKRAEARKFLQQAAGWTSRMAVAEWFSDSPPKVLKMMPLIGIADACRVDMRWLATGEGDMHPRQLPTDVLDVAKLLDKIQEPKLRKMAIQHARLLALDPLGQVTKLADAQRWTPNVQHIADGLESIEDPAQRKIAIAWATTAAFNPEQLPLDLPTAGSSAPRASGKRAAKR